MKAQIFSSNGNYEIVIENGTTLKGKTDLQSLKNKASDQVKKEYLEDLEFTVVDHKVIRRRNTTQLLAQSKKKEGLELEMILEVLQSRGHGAPNENTPTVVDIPSEDETEDSPELEEEEEITPEVLNSSVFQGVVKEITKQVEELPKKEPKAKKEDLPKTEKQLQQEVELKKQLDPVEAATLVAKYSLDKGRIISFTNRKGEFVSGPINGIRHDKRSGMIFYMVKTETGLFGKTVWSEDFTLSDIEGDNEPTKETK